MSNQQSETQDYSNPYAYPTNPSPNPTSSEDPALTKLKSAFWKNAGYVQATLGSLAGSSSWEQTGQQTQEEADRKYKDATTQHENGVPSRIYGEYDRFMGYLNYAVGHVAGDKEMQDRANQRAKHGSEEIDRTGTQ